MLLPFALASFVWGLNSTVRTNALDTWPPVAEVCGVSEAACSKAMDAVVAATRGNCAEASAAIDGLDASGDGEEGAAFDRERLASAIGARCDGVPAIPPVAGELGERVLSESYLQQSDPGERHIHLLMQEIGAGVRSVCAEAPQSDTCHVGAAAVAAVAEARCDDAWAAVAALRWRRFLDQHDESYMMRRVAEQVIEHCTDRP